jgi:uncharacterized Zn finger protein
VFPIPANGKAKTTKKKTARKTGPMAQEPQEPIVNQTMIREHASSETLQRGREYYNAGTVSRLTRRGNVVTAEVEGSDVEPYLVTATLPPRNEGNATCTCPYDWGGWCKHIVATLLAVMNEPEAVQESAPLDSLLATVDPDQLKAVVRALVAQDPRLTDEIEAQIKLQKSRVPAAGVVPASAIAIPPPSRPSSPSPPSLPPVDVPGIRRQLRTSLRRTDRMSGTDAYYYVGEVVGQVGNWLGDAQARVEAGDGRGALTLLEAITEEYLPAFDQLDDSDGEVSGLYDELGPIWTEALLTADLTQKERNAWAKKLAKWQDEIAEYGVDDAFRPAILAAEEGWDAPDIVAALAGKATQDEDRFASLSDHATQVTIARLNILERQGRLGEALNLARAEGLRLRTTTILTRLGRIAEAVEYGMQRFVTSGEAFGLAQDLQAQAASAEALQLGAHGLTLEGRKTELGLWLRDLALLQHDRDLAIRAALASLKETPDLNAYKRLGEIAGADWPGLRDPLLAEWEGLRGYVPRGAVEVFLFEGRNGPALDAVENSYDYELLGQVADAAVATHPDRVIAIGRKQAEVIMNQGKADRYDRAIKWLARAKAAYNAANRRQEWDSYLSDLLSLHGRKYKLVPMLQSLKK